MVVKALLQNERLRVGGSLNFDFRSSFEKGSKRIQHRIHAIAQIRYCSWWANPVELTIMRLYSLKYVKSWLAVATHLEFCYTMPRLLESLKGLLVNFNAIQRIA